MSRILSYEQCLPKHKYRYQTIPESLDKFAQDYSTREAYVFYEKDRRRTLTFQQVSDRSRAVAAGLLKLGLQPRDRVAILSDASREWLYVDYACLRIHVLMIRVPESLAASENLISFLHQYRCRMLFYNDKHSDALQKNLPSFQQLLQTAHFTESSDCEYPEIAVSLTRGHTSDSCLSILDLLKTKDADQIQVVQDIQDKIDPDDPAIVFATSGSTGIPKLVVLSHLAVVGRFIQFDRPTIEDDSRQEICVLNSRPFTWLGSVLYAPAITYRRYCHLNFSSAKNMDLYFEIMQEEKVTHTFFSVHNILSYMNHIIKIPTLTDILLAGETIPMSVVKTLLKNINGIRVLVAYASTETGVALKLFTAENLNGELDQVLLYPVPYVEIKLVSDKKIVQRGEPGVVLIRSPYSMEFYLDLPEETRNKKAASGWVNTEDLAIMHPCGGLQILGRESVLISKGSTKIYPVTLEQMLTKHPRVDTAVVFGVHDELYGQEIAACVSPKQGCQLTREELDDLAKLKIAMKKYMTFCKE